MAAADIILAAKEEAAIPAEVKPAAPSTAGTAPTATTAEKTRSFARWAPGADPLRNSVTVSGESAPSSDQGAEVEERVRRAEPACGRDARSRHRQLSNLRVTLGSSLPLTEPQVCVCV